MKKFRFVGLILTVCMLLFGSIASAQNVRTIAVDGASTIKTAPNKAAVNISIQNSSKDAAAASQENAIIMSRIQSAVLGLAITGDKIETVNYRLYPLYDTDSGERKIAGYSVTNEVRVTVDDVQKVGKIIDTAIAAGANRVDSVEFGLKNSQIYKDRALSEAVADARHKADVIAAALGKNIVNVVSISASNTYVTNRQLNNAQFMKRAAAADTAAASPISAGEVSVKASVSVVFEMN